MTVSRGRSALIGILFLVATATFFINNSLAKPILSSFDLVGTSADSRTTLGIAALLALADGVAVLAIAVIALPVLSAANRGIGNAYLAVRSVELTVILAYAVSPLLIASIAGEQSVAGSIGSTLVDVRDASLILIYVLNGIAGIILCTALWRNRLVPRSLAGLGLLGYGVLLVYSALAIPNLTRVTDDASIAALAPGGLFEILLPIWLIVRGFSTAAGKPSNTDVSLPR